MKHRKKKKILGRDKAHRKMLIKNLVKSFFIYEKIKTTEAKAKTIKPIVEKIITVGKKNNLSARRKIIKKIGSNKIANKILKEIAPKYKNRTGGYTRILKIGVRQGDGARVVYLTLI